MPYKRSIKSDSRSTIRKFSRFMLKTHFNKRLLNRQRDPILFLKIIPEISPINRTYGIRKLSMYLPLRRVRRGKGHDRGADGGGEGHPETDRHSCLHAHDHHHLYH